MVNGKGKGKSNRKGKENGSDTTEKKGSGGKGGAAGRGYWNLTQRKERKYGWGITQAMVDSAQKTASAYA